MYRQYLWMRCRLILSVLLLLSVRLSLCVYIYIYDIVYIHISWGYLAVANDCRVMGKSRLLKVMVTFEWTGGVASLVRTRSAATSEASVHDCPIGHSVWRCLRSRCLLKSIWCGSGSKFQGHFGKQPVFKQKTSQQASFSSTQLWTMLTSDESSSFFMLNQSIAKCHGMKDC